MNIMEVSIMRDPLKMRLEVVKMAKERNCTNEEIWELINNFRKLQEEGKRPQMASDMGGTLQTILSKTRKNKKHK